MNLFLLKKLSEVDRAWKMNLLLLNPARCGRNQGYELVPSQTLREVDGVWGMNLLLLELQEKRSLPCFVGKAGLSGSLVTRPVMRCPIGGIHQSH